MTGPAVDEWSLALADTLLPRDINAGRPVRLDCDDEALASAAAMLGLARVDAAAQLVVSLHSRYRMNGDDGIRALAADTGGEVPRYLPGLALLVVAASRMAQDELGSMAAYYARLASILGISEQPTWPQVRGVPELVARFDDLAEWMAGPQGGARGLLDLPPGVHPRVVGIPIRQSLLRAGDRMHLGAFFERTSRLIDAGWDPVHQLAGWGGRHALSQPLQTLLAEPQLHASLASALRAARRAWDGSTVDEAGRRVLPAELALHLQPGSLLISATVPGLGASVAATGPGGHHIRLDTATAADVPLDWLASAEAAPLVIDAGPERVRLFPGRTMIFEVTTLGMQSVATAAEEPVWILTCDQQLLAACDDHRCWAARLPDGWALVCDVSPELLSDDLRASRDEEHPLAGVHAAGGLLLDLETWLLHHPPQIVADLPEPARVTIDGRAHGDIESDRPLALDCIAHLEGTHRVRVGEQELSVELVARGPRAGVGTLAIDADPRRVHAGAAPVDARYPGPWICGAAIDPPAEQPQPDALLVRYRCTVDVIDVDGAARNLAPPAPAAWLDHVGLPQDGPWEIANAERVAWLCVDAPGRKFVVAHKAVDVPITDDVLDIVEWHADASRIVDRSDGHAQERWRRLVAALEPAP